MCPQLSLRGIGMHRFGRGEQQLRYINSGELSESMTSTQLEPVLARSTRLLFMFQSAFHRDPTPEELEIFIIGKYFGVADAELFREYGEQVAPYKVRYKALRFGAWPCARKTLQDLEPQLAPEPSLGATVRTKRFGQWVVKLGRGEILIHKTSRPRYWS